MICKQSFVCKFRDGFLPSPPHMYFISLLPLGVRSIFFPHLPTVPAPFCYLCLCTARLPQTLTCHLDCLVCTGKLCGFHQPLLSCLAVGVRDANQICCLREKTEKTECGEEYRLWMAREG